GGDEPAVRGCVGGRICTAGSTRRSQNGSRQVGNCGSDLRRLLLHCLEQRHECGGVCASLPPGCMHTMVGRIYGSSPGSSIPQEWRGANSVPHAARRAAPPHEPTGCSGGNGAGLTTRAFGSSRGPAHRGCWGSCCRRYITI